MISSLFLKQMWINSRFRYSTPSIVVRRVVDIVRWVASLLILPLLSFLFSLSSFCSLGLFYMISPLFLTQMWINSRFRYSTPSIAVRRVVDLVRWVASLWGIMPFLSLTLFACKMNDAISISYLGCFTPMLIACCILMPLSWFFFCCPGTRALHGLEQCEGVIAGILAFLAELFTIGALLIILLLVALKLDGNEVLVNTPYYLIFIPFYIFSGLIAFFPILFFVVITLCCPCLFCFSIVTDPSAALGFCAVCFACMIDSLTDGWMIMMFCCLVMLLFHFSLNPPEDDAVMMVIFFLFPFVRFFFLLRPLLTQGWVSLCSVCSLCLFALKSVLCFPFFLSVCFPFQIWFMYLLIATFCAAFGLIDIFSSIFLFIVPLSLISFRFVFLSCLSFFLPFQIWFMYLLIAAFCAAFGLMGVFPALQLDGIINWPWTAVFIPHWILFGVSILFYCSFTIATAGKLFNLHFASIDFEHMFS